MTTDRRSFLASVGASVATGLAWSGCVPNAQSVAHAASPKQRGVVPAGDLMIDPDLAYVQTGSLGPTPRPVLERTIAVWRELERDPTALGYGPLEQGMELVRAKAAALLGCDLRELVITTSTTEGINWVAQGVALVPGDRILTTDQEHPGGRVAGTSSPSAMAPPSMSSRSRWARTTPRRSSSGSRGSSRRAPACWRSRTC